MLSVYAMISLKHDAVLIQNLNLNLRVLYLEILQSGIWNECQSLMIVELIVSLDAKTLLSD
jgi:tRNA(Glu) U13 pseudouridine synthase TruD